MMRAPSYNVFREYLSLLQGSSVTWLDAERALIRGERRYLSRSAACSEGAVYDVQRSAWTSMSPKNPPLTQAPLDILEG